MFLIDWFQANMLMLFTVLCLIGIPTVILIIAFGKKTPPKSEQEL